MFCTQSRDVTFHGVGDPARLVSLDGLAKVGRGRVVVRQGAETGFQDLDQVGVDFGRIVDDVAVIDVDTNKTFAGRVLWVNLEKTQGSRGSEEKPARENW